MFTGLTTAELTFLATSLDEGSLGPPYSELALWRKSLPVSVLADLGALEQKGFSAQQMAILARSVAEATAKHQRQEAKIELVATGPDATAHVRDTAVVAEQLFAEGLEHVLVVGFKVYDGDAIFATLAKRMETIPGLAVTCCFDIGREWKDDRYDYKIVSEFAKRFAKWWPGVRRPNVYYDPRSLGTGSGERAVLHAKTVVVDSHKAFITSANPTTAAYQRNIELGVLISGGSIPPAVESHFTHLIKSGVLRNLAAQNL